MKETIKERKKALREEIRELIKERQALLIYIHATRRELERLKAESK